MSLPPHLADLARDGGALLGPIFCFAVGAILLWKRRTGRLTSRGVALILFLFAAALSMAGSIVLALVFPADATRDHLADMAIAIAPLVTAMTTAPVLLLFVVGLALVRPLETAAARRQPP